MVCYYALSRSGLRCMFLLETALLALHAIFIQHFSKHWLPLIRITLGQHVSDNWNRMLTLFWVFCLVRPPKNIFGSLFNCKFFGKKTSRLSYFGPGISVQNSIPYNRLLIISSVIQISAAMLNLQPFSTFSTEFKQRTDIKSGLKLEAILMSRQAYQHGTK